MTSGLARSTLYRDRMDLVAGMTALLDEFYGAVEAGDASSFDEALAADVIMVGTDEAEWWEGPGEALRAMRAQFAEMSDAGVRFTGGHYQIVAQGDVVWAVDRPTVHLADGTATPLRMTAVATAEGDHLVVRHMHLSAAAPNQEIVKQELTV
jgi:ketosteroid isomerase-like protein